MINTKIIKLASNSKFAGLKNIFTHKSTMKNTLCGDFIKIEVIADKKRIKSMRYEVESCILCEASASLLAQKIKNLEIKYLKSIINILNNQNKKDKINFSHKFKSFNLLLNKSTKSRANCVILPIEALLKAFKMSQ